MGASPGFGLKFSSRARWVFTFFSVFVLITVAGALFFCWEEYSTAKTASPSVRPQYADLASAMASVTGALASFATLLYIIKEQQKLFESQFRLQASSAQLQVAVSRIETSKAVLDTLRQGADVPFRDQEFGSQKADFDLLRSKFGDILVEEQLKKALEYIDHWEKAAHQRDRALRNLESPGLGETTVF